METSNCGNFQKAKNPAPFDRGFRKDINFDESIGEFEAGSRRPNSK
jgi:hypothetical protein